jgi:hypothetical protein
MSSIFRAIWDEIRETYSQSIVGSYGAVWGEQLQRNSDGFWESKPSPYKFMRNDRRENGSDTWSVGWNQLGSATTGGIGVAILAGAKELSITTLSIYAVPILLTQAVVRVLFNSRELEGAQNRNLNKKVKTSINLGIMLTYIVGTIFTFAYATLATSVLPLMAFSISTIRAIQGGVYGAANAELRSETDSLWDPLQYERALVQEIKRKSQFFGSGSAAALSGAIAFGGYSVGLPAVFGVAIAIGTVAACITLYLGLREFPPFNRWFRARSVFAPQLNPYNKKNKGYVIAPSDTLNANPSPSAHQAFLRDESWWLKKERLENKDRYYDMRNPPKTIDDFNERETYKRKTRFPFHGDIYQEMDAIFHCHPKERISGKPINESAPISFEEKKELCKKYIRRLIQEHRKELVDQKSDATNMTWSKRLGQIWNLNITASIEQIQDKIDLLDCLDRLVVTDNEAAPIAETSESSSPFKTALNQCSTYDDVHDCLINNPKNMRNALKGEFRKFPGCEVFMRILSPAQPTETFGNKGYFCRLNEQKERLSFSLLKKGGSEATMATIRTSRSSSSPSFFDSPVQTPNRMNPADRLSQNDYNIEGNTVITSSQLKVQPNPEPLKASEFFQPTTRVAPITGDSHRGIIPVTVHKGSPNSGTADSSPNNTDSELTHVNAGGALKI